MIIALRSCWLDTGGDDSVTGSARPVSSVSGGAPSGSGSRWTEPSGSRLSPVTQRFLLESQKPPAESRSARMSWRGGGGNLSTYNPTTRLAFAVRPQSFSIFCSLMWRASRSTSFASMSSAPASSESSFRSAPTSSRMKRSLWRGRGAGCE